MNHPTKKTRNQTSHGNEIVDSQDVLVLSCLTSAESDQNLPDSIAPNFEYITHYA
jgi:hypothetical protein